MPKFNHEDLEAVLNVIYRKGTITAVNADDDTADVDAFGGKSGKSIPIYYHCEPDSELRDNGAIEGAAAGFSVDDEVIVMCDTEGAPLRIIGFVDGIRPCGGFVVFTFTYEGIGYHTVWDPEQSKISDSIGFEFPCTDDAVIDGGTLTFKEWLDSKNKITPEHFWTFNRCSENIPNYPQNGTIPSRCQFGPDGIDSFTYSSNDEDYECAHEFWYDEYGNKHYDANNTPVGYYGGMARNNVSLTHRTIYGIPSSNDPAIYSMGQPTWLSSACGPFISAIVKDANDEVVPDIQCRQDLDYSETFDGSTDCYYYARSLTARSFKYSFVTPLGSLMGLSLSHNDGYADGPFDTDWNTQMPRYWGCPSGSETRAVWEDFEETGFYAPLAWAVQADKIKLQVYFYDCVMGIVGRVYTHSGCIGATETQTTTYERHNDFMAAIDYFPGGNAKESDPLSQVQNIGLTNALKDLHIYALIEAVVPNDKVLTDLNIVFI
jgi:hypothetical protein